MRKFLVGTLILTSWNVMASYSLHIERENRISESEWLAICDSDSSLRVQHSAKATNPQTSEVIEIQTPNSCVGRAQSYEESIILLMLMAVFPWVAIKLKSKKLNS